MARNAPTQEQQLKANFELVSAMLGQEKPLGIRNLLELAKKFIPGVDEPLLRHAATVSQRLEEGKIRGFPARPVAQEKTYAVETACIVAAQSLDPFSTTKCEALIAALIQGHIAAQPDKSDVVRKSLEEFAHSGNAMYRQSRLDAINEAFWIAEQIAPITAAPRDYALEAAANNDNKLFVRFQGALMATDSARAVRIKHAEAIVRALRINDVPDESEKQKIGIILERGYGPSMEATGWHTGNRTVQDFLLRQRDPAEYERITTEVKRLYGEDIYKDEKELVDAARAWLFSHLKKPAEENDLEIEVYCRLKSVSSIAKKIKQRRAHKNDPTYDVANLKDVFGFEIVLRHKEGGKAAHGDDPIKLEADLCLLGNSLMPTRQLILTEHDPRPLYGDLERPESGASYRALHTSYRWKDGIQFSKDARTNTLLQHLVGHEIEIKFVTEGMREQREHLAAHHIYKMDGGIQGVPEELIKQTTERADVHRRHLSDRFRMPDPGMIDKAAIIFVFGPDGKSYPTDPGFEGLRNGVTVMEPEVLEAIRRNGARARSPEPAPAK